MQIHAPRTFLLCGPIGAGKSTVGIMLASRGALVIDADKVGHEVMKPDGAAWSAVTARWPAVVVGGVIDRTRLAAVVFSDPGELEALEELTHPAIGGEILRRVAAAQERVIVVEVPLLKDVVGRGWPRLVVDAPEMVRVARLQARGMERAEIDRRMGAQPGRDDWLGAAGHVIDNSGTLVELASEVDELWGLMQEADFLVSPAE